LAGSYKLLVRHRSRFERKRYDDLDAALEALEERGREIAETADAETVDLKIGRKFDPVQQVVGRLEVRGPKIRGGVDVRGDGSTEAFTGWIKRRLVEQRHRETAYEALRRELA
jgi:hypothetical protein